MATEILTSSCHRCVRPLFVIRQLIQCFIWPDSGTNCPTNSRPIPLCLPNSDKRCLKLWYTVYVLKTEIRQLSVYRIIKLKARLGSGRILLCSGVTSALKRKKAQANISKYFQRQDHDAAPVGPVSKQVHDDAEVPPVTPVADRNEVTGPRPPVDEKDDDDDWLGLASIT